MEQHKRIAGILVEYAEDLQPGAIDVAAAFRFLQKNARWALLFLAFGMACGLTISIVMPRIYAADTVVAIRSQPDTNLLSSSGLGSLAGLARSAGILDPSSVTEKWTAVLKGRSMGMTFILEEGLDSVLVQPSIVGRLIGWKSPEVDESERLRKAYKIFDEKVRQVRVDDRTGLVTLTFNWGDPEAAARLADAYVRSANLKIRDNEILDAEKNMAYLTNLWKQSDQISVKDAAASLLQSQLHRIMLAQSREDFAFEVLESATAPGVKDYVSPKPILLVLFGGLLATLIGLVGVWLRSDQ